MTATTDQRALRSVALQFFVNGAVWASYVPRLPEIRDRLDLDLAQLGLIMTIGMLGGLVGSAVAGSLIDRYGSKRVMMVGSFGLVWALPIMGFAANGYVLLMGMIALHFFDVLTDIAMNLQGSWLSARRHAPIMNRLHGLWSVGTVLGGIAAAQIAGAGVGITPHLVTVSVVLTLGLALLHRGLLTSDEPATEPSRSSAHPTFGRTAVILGMLGFAAMVTELIPAEWAALRMVDDLSATVTVGGYGYVAFTTGMVVGRLAGDWVTARTGSTQFIRIATVLGMVGLAIGSLSSTATGALVGYFIAGLGVAGLFPQLYDRAAKAPGRSGAGLGMMTAGTRLGGFAAPIIVGAVAETSLTVGQAMAIVTIPCGVLIVLLSD